MQKCVPLGCGFLPFDLENKMFGIKVFIGLCNIPDLSTAGSWNGFVDKNTEVPVQKCQSYLGCVLAL